MMKTIYLSILAVTIFMSACADPAANKPKAGAADPVTRTETVPQTQKPSVLSGYKPAGTPVKISIDTSKIEFTGSKVTGKHDGGFKSFVGIIDLIGDKPETSKVLFEIDMSSVFTDTDGVTKHLKTGDFFEIEKFPTSSFESTKIEPDAAKPGTYTVTGDLEMRGVKKSIKFPATIKIGSPDVTVKAEFSINRKDFGIVYAGKADDLIRDDVVIRLDIKAAVKK